MNIKKKYYLRGMGFGIFITAFILMFVHKNDTLTETEMIKKVKEMGYSVVKEEAAETTPGTSIDLNSLKQKLTGTPTPTVAPTNP